MRNWNHALVWLMADWFPKLYEYLCMKSRDSIEDIGAQPARWQAFLWVGAWSKCRGLVTKHISICGTGYMIEVKFSYQYANTASSWEYFCQEMQMVRSLLNFGKLCKVFR